MADPARDTFRAHFTPPAWTRGGISADDAVFLWDLILDHRPRTVLEVGVAAGTSSAAILLALDQLEAPEARTLFSVDVAARCYFDPRRATGAAVAELYPHPRARWHLDPACDARQAAAGRIPPALDLAFIDANHRHPWPLADLLHIAPRLRPRSWIALHDIDLARLYPEYAQEGRGAEYLFAAWPFDRRRAPGPTSNIGAVQLPADLEALRPMTAALLAIPWEVPAGAVTVPAL